MQRQCLAPSPLMQERSPTPYSPKLSNRCFPERFNPAPAACSLCSPHTQLLAASASSAGTPAPQEGSGSTGCLPSAGVSKRYLAVVTGGHQTLDLAARSDRVKVPHSTSSHTPNPEATEALKKGIPTGPHTPTPRSIYNMSEVVCLTSHFLADPLPWQ